MGRASKNDDPYVTVVERRQKKADVVGRPSALRRKPEADQHRSMLPMMHASMVCTCSCSVESGPVNYEVDIRS